MSRAELSGPYQEKLTSHIKDSAMILWKIYSILTIILILLLLLGGMSLFDAVCHSFSTMATGGFSTRNASVAAFNSPYIEWVITIFMLSLIHISSIYPDDYQECLVPPHKGYKG